ncbi:cadherin-related family member 1-like, partial [Saccoglossus kowalevskii]
CDFTYEAESNPSEISSEIYEERPVGEIIFALDFVGIDIELELVDTTAYLNVLDYLQIDGQNITWKKQYDLDDKRKNRMTVTLNCIQNGNVERTVNVVIDIFDVNDNDPYFIGGPYVLNISELWPPGIVIFDGVEADDNDIDTSSTELLYSYEAEGFGDFIFTAKEELMIAPAGLDYETRSFYNVTLFVKDDRDDSEARTGISYLFINVLDGDDQNPVFGSTHYSATVIEEVSGVTLDVNPPIYAYDPDFGLNETIIYSFANDVFTVETVSDGRLTLGQVKVKDNSALDADNGQTYYNLTPSQMTSWAVFIDPASIAKEACEKYDIVVQELGCIAKLK